jgi:hypothetical protein
LANILPVLQSVDIDLKLRVVDSGNFTVESLSDANKFHSPVDEEMKDVNSAFYWQYRK